MLNYWEKHLFPQFLQSIDSCTLSDFSNFEIQNQLNYLVIRAIHDFKFPRYSLEYVLDETVSYVTGEINGYYFVDSRVGQAEFNVILARMKQY